MRNLTGQPGDHECIWQPSLGILWFPKKGILYGNPPPPPGHLNFFSKTFFKMCACADVPASSPQCLLAYDRPWGTWPVSLLTNHTMYGNPPPPGHLKKKNSKTFLKYVRMRGCAGEFPPVLVDLWQTLVDLTGQPGNHVCMQCTRCSMVDNDIIPCVCKYSNTLVTLRHCSRTRTHKRLWTMNILFANHPNLATLTF